MPLPRHVEEIVNHQLRKQEIIRSEGGEPEPCSTIVVTMSRAMGSGARTIAQRVAQDLGWTLWDRELIDAIVADTHVSRKIVESFDEHARSQIELLVEDAFGHHEESGFSYPKHLGHVLASISKLGQAIILGRGANFLLPDAISIRVDAPMDKRIANLACEGTSAAEAKRLIEESDRDREKFFANVFGKHKVASTYYDIQLWMDKLTIDDAVEIVKAAIASRCKATAFEC